VAAVFTDAFDGLLSIGAKLLDTHLRFLADCLLSGSTASTTAGYASLEALPPQLRRQHTSGAAAVGAAGLLHLREEAKLLQSMLSFVESGEGVDEEALQEFRQAKALCRAVDLVIAAMPQPKED
jgi:hypothetical protein